MKPPNYTLVWIVLGMVLVGRVFLVLLGATIGIVFDGFEIRNMQR